jgi:hypothetical protein
LKWIVLPELQPSDHSQLTKSLLVMLLLLRLLLRLKLLV